MSKKVFYDYRCRRRVPLRRQTSSSEMRNWPHSLRTDPMDATRFTLFSRIAVTII